MFKFKLSFGIAVIILATALSAPAYAAKSGGGGGGGGGGHAAGGGGGGHGGGGGMRWWWRTCCRRRRRWSCARWRRRWWRASHQRQTGNIPFDGTAKFARQTDLRGKHSGEQCRRPNDAAQCNRECNAQCKPDRKSKPQISRRAQHAEGSSVAGALRRTSALRNPSNRARITASAATAGWHNGRDGGNGWWRHGHGGYGWVGPLYWPFAYYDMYDYAMWGYGYDDLFWDYGYGDIYAGIFAPYGYDDLTGYMPQYAGGNPSETAPAPGAPAAAPDELTQMCGDDSRDIAGLPIDQIQQAIQPTAEQGAALDDLANASLKAAQDIKAACPTDIALTAPNRLAAMQKRIEAMIAAVQTVQPPLEKFYGLLSDEQKARLTALGNDQRQSKASDDTTGSLAQSCSAAPPGVMDWPTAEIDQTVRPTDAQRASLVALQNATAQAADLLKTSCLSSDPLTPPARLAAVGKRLDTMLQAVKMVSAALNDFYGTLSDEQKARFEAIGPQRTAQAESLEVAPTETHRLPAPPSQPRANHSALAGTLVEHQILPRMGEGLIWTSVLCHTTSGF